MEISKCPGASHEEFLETALVNAQSSRKDRHASFFLRPCYLCLGETFWVWRVGWDVFLAVGQLNWTWIFTIVESLPVLTWRYSCVHETGLLSYVMLTALHPHRGTVFRLLTLDFERSLVVPVCKHLASSGTLGNPLLQDFLSSPCSWLLYWLGFC